MVALTDVILLTTVVFLIEITTGDKPYYSQKVSEPGSPGVWSGHHHAGPMYGAGPPRPMDEFPRGRPPPPDQDGNNLYYELKLTQINESFIRDSGTFRFDEGNTVEIVCKKNLSYMPTPQSTQPVLHWEDNTAIKSYPSIGVIKLVLTPTINDKGLRITCVETGEHAAPPISITLNQVDAQNILLNEKVKTAYHKKGETVYVENTCNYVVRYPNVVAPVLLHPNVIVIQHFEPMHNGTITDCVLYKPEGKLNGVETWTRLRERTIHYLELETVTKTESLYISVTKLPFESQESLHLIKANSSLGFKEGDRFQLTCMETSGQAVNLHWEDSFGFKIKPLRSRSLALEITPDIDDVGLRLSCVETGVTRKALSVLFYHFTNDTRNKEINTISINAEFLTNGSSIYANKTCTGIIHRSYKSAPIQVNPNGLVIGYFTKEDNGTIIDCIVYKKLRIHENQTFWGREKERTIYYLKSDTEAIQVDGYNNIESTSSEPIIIGCIIGFLMLVGLLFTSLWYKRTRCLSPRAEPSVVYIEVDVGSACSSPPRRDEQPYATIIGSMMPKRLVQDDTVYSTVVHS